MTLEEWFESVDNVFKQFRKTEDFNGTNDTTDKDVFDIARAIAKAIILAKNAGVLPHVLEEFTKTPEDIAVVSSKCAAIYDTIRRVADGDLDQYSKFANRLIDWAYAIAVSTVDWVIQKGMPFVKNLTEIAAEVLGGFFGYPGLSKIVDLLFNIFYPKIANKLKDMCMEFLHSAQEWGKQLVAFINEKISKCRETKRKRRQHAGKTKQNNNAEEQFNETITYA